VRETELPSPGSADFSSNAMLARMPDAARRALLEHARPLELDPGATLHRFGDPTANHVFPLTGMISLTIPTPDGHQVEVALVGREGMTGVNRLLGSDGRDLHAIAQAAGEALAVPASRVTGPLAELLQPLANRYAASLLLEVAQTAACNRLHSVEERTARWLLHASDRARTDNLRLTHEFLGMMLAVRRASVTVVVGTFQRAGLIRTERGRISIADRDGLAGVACPCYLIVRGAAPQYD
jgi:CRP-like cAMP-binding protein